MPLLLADYTSSGWWVGWSGMTQPIDASSFASMCAGFIKPLMSLPFMQPVGYVVIACLAAGVLWMLLRFTK
jgi:hypothetical protein